MKFSLLTIIAASALCAGAFAQANDDCANAQVIAGCGSFVYDTSLATQDGLGDPLCFKFGTSQIAHDVWFSWTAPTAGSYTMDTCIGGGPDDKIAVYSDTGVCPPTGALDCNDDTCGLNSMISWNATAGQGYLLRIGTFPSAVGGPGFFDLTGCGTVLGTNYCISTVNSTGAASIISAIGSTSIAANNLLLSADSLPAQPGIFIAGPGQGQLPFFNGFLCIDPNGLQRFVDTSAPTGGVITEAVDFATSALGGLNVAAGSSYNYQRWNRDPAGGGGNANFSDGLEIVHTP